MMADAGFIIGSYVLTFAAIALYGWNVIRRGRAMSEHVPDDERYWT